MWYSVVSRKSGGVVKRFCCASDEEARLYIVLNFSYNGIVKKQKNGVITFSTDNDNFFVRRE